MEEYKYNPMIGTEAPSVHGATEIICEYY